MVIVQFTEGFEKELKKYLNKAEATTVVKNLAKTQPTDGDYVALVANILLKERKIKSFRFYFVQDNKQIQFLSKEELKNRILKFIAISKKNNQQDVIDKLKDDLKKFGF